MRHVKGAVQFHHSGAERGGTNTGWSVAPCVAGTPVCSHIQWTRTGPARLEDLTQLSLLVPISSEQAEEAEKEDLRVQLKRHHPSSPLSGSKASKRPKIKVSLISQGDPAGGPCTPTQGGTPEGEFPLTELSPGS